MPPRSLPPNDSGSPEVPRGRPGPSPDTDPDVARVAHELGRLQAFRGWRGRDVSIDGILDRIRRDARRDHGRLADIADAWQATVPAALLDHTALVGLRAGVLTVAVDGSSTKYRLDRHFRGRGLAELRGASPMPIARVKTQLDPARFADDHDDDPRRMPPEVDVRTPRRS